MPRRSKHSRFGGLPRHPAPRIPGGLLWDLREWRLAGGYTQKILSVAIGLGAERLGKIDAGYRPMPPEAMAKLVALGFRSASIKPERPLPPPTRATFEFSDFDNTPIGAV